MPSMGHAIGPHISRRLVSDMQLPSLSCRTTTKTQDQLQPGGRHAVVDGATLVAAKPSVGHATVPLLHNPLTKEKTKVSFDWGVWAWSCMPNDRHATASLNKTTGSCGGSDTCSYVPSGKHATIPSDKTTQNCSCIIEKQL